MSGSVSSSQPERALVFSLERELTELLGSAQEARWLVEDSIASPAPAESARRLAARRLAGEPLQHILSHWGFRSLEVQVDARALVPRPETEVVAGVAIAELARTGGRLSALEIGTGSGVIACSLACEVGRRLQVVATDLSRAALSLAHQNVVATLGEEVLSAGWAGGGPRVVLTEGSFFEPLAGEAQGSFDLVVSNPPYLASSEWESLDPVVRNHDPYMALVAGELGTEAIEKIVADAPRWLKPTGSLVVEIAPHHQEVALSLAASAGFSESQVLDDLAGRPRVLLARS